MEKKYLAKIIALDKDGLQMISACCSGAEIKIDNIKFLKKNKVFLLSLKRNKVESNEKRTVNSICKFDFVDRVKSKNINQNELKQTINLIGIDYLKNEKNYEINLIFNNNGCITLYTEIIEVRLEDQNEIE
tara:strand:+ start:93 stop:485 length:393 start_codon:yes stop_codon:yes gene_type:complete